MKKTRDTYHHGNLAESLLDAVEDLATRFGLDAVSLRACAKQIGVSPSSAFRHYPDTIEKPALFRAMWREDTIYAADENYREAPAALTRQLTAGFGDALQDCDPDNLSEQELLVWSTLHGLAVLFTDGPLNQIRDDSTRLETANRVIDQLMPALHLN